MSRAKSLRIVSSRLLEGLLSGGSRSVFRGIGIEFDEVREYTNSDDVRSIDWNVTARMGSPYTKTFREEREILLYIILDLSASMFSGRKGSAKIDAAAEISALVVLAAVQNNDRVGGVFFTDRVEKWIPAAKGISHGSRMVRDVGTFTPVGKGSDIALAIRTAYEAMERRGICMIVSDFRSATGLKEASLLSRKHDVIAVRVLDAHEFRLPASGYLQIVDPESGRALSVSGGSSGFQREFRDFWRADHAIWERNYRRRGIATLSVSPDEDLTAQLIAFFDARKGR